jgi:hypothetical protein
VTTLNVLFFALKIFFKSPTPKKVSASVLKRVALKLHKQVLASVLRFFLLSLLSVSQFEIFHFFCLILAQFSWLKKKLNSETSSHASQ